jgi:hypothetical protein
MYLSDWATSFECETFQSYFTSKINSFHIPCQIVCRTIQYRPMSYVIPRIPRSGQSNWTQYIFKPPNKIRFIIFYVSTTATVWIEIFWTVSICRFLGGYQRFGETFCLYLQCLAMLLNYPPMIPTHIRVTQPIHPCAYTNNDGGDSTFHRNVDIHLQDYTASKH